MGSGQWRRQTMDSLKNAPDRRTVPLGRKVIGWQIGIPVGELPPHGQHGNVVAERVTAQLLRDPNLVSGPQTVRAGGRSVTFGSGDETSLTVPLHPSKGVCRAVFMVTPTAVPGPADTRVLGVHFLEFRYAAP